VVCGSALRSCDCLTRCAPTPRVPGGGALSRSREDESDIAWCIVVFMGRTQIYLSEEELGLLDRAAAETGASRSELIRRAIRRTFGEESREDRLVALRRSAGSWKRRRFTGSEYVDALRGDLNERLRRVGLE